MNEREAVQLVVVVLAGEQYALPIRFVQEIIRYTEPRSVGARSATIRGVISLRGKILPVIDLASRLGTPTEVSERTKIVVVEAADAPVGVIVDDVDEVLTIERAQIEQTPTGSGIEATAIAKIQDRLVVLLDPEQIAPCGQPEEEPAHAPAGVSEAAAA